MAKRLQARLNQQAPMARPVWLARLPLLGGGLALVALVAAAMVWLLNPQHLPLRTVRVQGQLAHVTPADIRAAVAPYAKQGFLHVDIVAVRNALEKVPWIYSAQVTRSWPDALLVTIQEQQVLARWGARGAGGLQRSPRRARTRSGSASSRSSPRVNARSATSAGASAARCRT